MRILTALAVSLALLSPALGNTANLGDEAGRAKALELALAWVTHHTDYAVVPPVQGYVVLAPEAMAAQAAKLYPARPPQDVFAMFSCGDHTMYFRNDSDLDNPLVFSFLVREVVRYAQCENDVSANSRCELARQPYWAQAKFIRATPGLFASQGRQMSAAQTDFLDRVALDVDKLADRACSAAARQP
jgi:hypothetical protein